MSARDCQRNRWLVPIGDTGHLELTRRPDGTAWFSVSGYDDAPDHDFSVILQPYEITLLVAALADMTRIEP